MNRLFVVSAALLVLAACNPSPSATGTAAEGAAPQAGAATATSAQTATSAEAASVPLGPPRVSSVACTRPSRPDPAFGELEVVVEEGWALQALPGVLTCGQIAEDGSVSCQANAGSVYFSLQDAWWYDIPAGRTATIAIDQSGNPSCFLNEAG